MRACALAVALVLGAGCGGKLVAPPADCVDRDEDGFGVGVDCRGADCDDADPLAHDVCAPACEAGSREPGCPCEPGPIADPCYTGPEGTADVGICRSGVRRCRDAVWTSCEDEVLPEPSDGDAEVFCDE